MGRGITRPGEGCRHDPTHRTLLHCVVCVYLWIVRYGRVWLRKNERGSEDMLAILLILGIWALIGHENRTVGTAERLAESRMFRLFLGVDILLEGLAILGIVAFILLL